MTTTCDRCTKDVEDDEVSFCQICERDGLCPECAPHDVHAAAESKR